MRTKVGKWGKTLAIRIPKRVAIELHIAEGTAVDLAVRDRKLVVAHSATRRYSLEELLAGVTAKNRHGEIDFGLPVGNEAW